MEITSVCLMISATLSIQPDRSQFFRYESFSLGCPDSSSNWTVIRNTTSEPLVPCRRGWGRRNGSSCLNRSVYTSDSGQYWCQSEEGMCSNALSITVHAGVVILESPALPVMKGSKVTLRCSYKERYAEKSSSDFKAAFYKDGVFVGYHTAEMILLEVSKSNEGLYKCRHPIKGVSPESRLTVRDDAKPTIPSATPGPPVISVTNLVCFILLLIFYTVILILCLYTMKKLAQDLKQDDLKDWTDVIHKDSYGARAEAKSRASYDLE